MKMNRNEAENYVKNQLETYLKGKGIDTRNAFRCLSPDHEDKTPSMFYKVSSSGNPYCVCYGCGRRFSTIDLIGLDYGLKDTGEIFKKAYEVFNIDLEDNKSSGDTMKNPGAVPVNNLNLHNNYTQQSYTTQQEEDFTRLYYSAAADIEKTDYHRGISLETLKKYYVGFVADWKHPKKPYSSPTPRLIIPVSKYSYIARYTGKAPEGVNAKEKAKFKDNVSWIYNLKELNNPQKPVFIVEGELDALSLIDCGATAVALGSASFVNMFLKETEKREPKQPFIVCLDNDKAGKEASEKLINGLETQGHTVKVWNIAGEYKDANERLCADRERMAYEIAQINNNPDVAKDAKQLMEEEKEAEERKEISKDNAYGYMPSFLKEIRESKNATYYPTGFKALDMLLDGGLHAGLHTVGAVSSLGKTSFTLQIADQVAAAGNPVLIFSLEMARKELIAKSVSRYSFIVSEASGDWRHRTAKTTRGVLDGSRYANYSREDIICLESAVGKYADNVAERIYITEGLGDVGVSQIRQKVERFIRVKEQKPLVLVDYLQILQPEDIHMTDKQAVDKSVLELKKLSRDFNIPVVVISSFNRENYYSPVNLTSFKESGAVEYSSDILIGLQYRGMDWKDGETEKQRNSRIRDLNKTLLRLAKEGSAQEIQLKVLKNRNGSKGDCFFNYWPMFNIFKEAGAGEPENHEGYGEKEDNEGDFFF